MIEFIPLESYTAFYFYFLMFIALIILFKSSSDITSSNNVKGKDLFGKVLLILILIYIGLRPISYVFGDMGTYNKTFDFFYSGGKPSYTKDVLFEFLLYQSTKIGSAQLFFFICAFLYIFPAYYFSKKIFNDYWFYSFFMIIASLSFWTYGTNGIRNGIATSLFLYGFAVNNKLVKYSVFVFSFFIHQSLLLPITAFVLTGFYKNPKMYLYSWLTTIPLSLVFAGFFTAFFLTLGVVEQDNVSGYLGDFDQESEGIVLKAGFRWDFLLYSAIGVFSGWYFIFKKKYQDKNYIQLFNLYLALNGFWVLVITANFSNRFAYLSWFLLGPLVIYPLLKVRLFKNQHLVTALIIFGYTLFTFLFAVVLA